MRWRRRAVARVRRAWLAEGGCRDWDAVRERFEAGFKRALTLADDKARVTCRLRRRSRLDFLASYTVSDALIHLALHMRITSVR